MRGYVAAGAVLILGIAVTACGGPSKGALTQAQQRQAEQEATSTSSTATTGGSTSTSSTATTGGASSAMTATTSTTSSTSGAATSTTSSSSADTAKGKQLFQAVCAGCHTLSDAGATGNVGPNLDQLKPSESVVLNQINTGGGPMPAHLYTGQNATDVAAYVASVAGK